MFRFAILGAGKIAAQFVKAARAEGCEVCAVASKSLEKAQNFARDNAVEGAYGSYSEMLYIEKPDCAYIATVPSSHYELSMLCMEMGVPVLCEKAMFRNSEEAISAFAQSKEKGLFMMEALWSKFLPANKCAKAWIDAGRIGKPVLCDSAIGFCAPKDPQNRYFNPDLGGGVALDITVYAYEIAAFLLGQELALDALSVVRGETGTDDTEILLMRACDCLATIRASFVTPFRDMLTVQGDRGRIEIPFPHFAKEALLYDAGGRLIEHFIDNETEMGFQYEIAEVRRCVEAGLYESPIQPHSATIACAKLFDRIFEA